MGHIAFRLRVAEGAQKAFDALPTEVKKAVEEKTASLGELVGEMNSPPRKHTKTTIQVGSFAISLEVRPLAREVIVTSVK